MNIANKEIPSEITEAEKKYKRAKEFETTAFDLYKRYEKKWRIVQKIKEEAGYEYGEIIAKYFPPKKFSFEWFRRFHPGIFLILIICFAGGVPIVMLYTLPQSAILVFIVFSVFCSLCFVVYSNWKNEDKENDKS
jgi:hypothetical protein